MSDEKNLRITAQDKATNKLSALIAGRLAVIASKIDKGVEPSSDDVDALDRLDKVKTTLAALHQERSKKLEIALLCFTVLIFGGLAVVRLRSTSADFEVRATKIHLTLQTPQSTTLIPGELGQILSLKEARVAGADSVRPGAIADNGSFEVKALAPDAKTKVALSTEDSAVRLQEIALPGNSPMTIVVGVAYDGDLRGLTLATSGSQAVKVALGQVIPVQGSQSDPKVPRYGISPIRAEGNNLSLEFIPMKSESELTVFRDIHVSKIEFDEEQHSTVLGGNAFVKGGSDANVELKPSDQLTIQSDEPMLLRELTLTKGELKIRLSARKAKTLLLGEAPARNLIPTVFQWIRYRWPSELYAALSALVVAWLAIRKWMSSSE
jgi:hypothetical protein